MKLAVCQCYSRIADVAANLAELETCLREISGSGCSLAVFPELFLTGYSISDEQVKVLAEPVNGAMIQAVQALCVKYSIAVVVGYPEAADGRIYNSAVCISAEGTTLANYRKTQLWGPDERRLFVPGDNQFPIVNIAGVKVGLMICFELEFPEITRCLSLQGARVVVCPTACSSTDGVMSRVSANARATENHVFIIYANMCPEPDRADATPFCGQSAIIAPNGVDIVRAGATRAVLVGDVSWTDVYQRHTERNPYERDRRPELYGALKQSN